MGSKVRIFARHERLNATLLQLFVTRGGDRNLRSGGTYPLLSPPSLLTSHPFPSPVHLPSYLPSPPLSLPLEVESLLNQTGDLGECCKLPQQGSGLRPRLKTKLVYSKATRKPLVAMILSILKCMFYSRTASVGRPGGDRAGSAHNPPLVSW